jgi:hypothetical protein
MAILLENPNNPASVNAPYSSERDARARYAGNTRPEYSGPFTGEIKSINTDGTAVVKTDGINPPEVVARLNVISGTNNEATGVHAPPVVGAKCVCAFLNGVNRPGNAVILTYYNAGQAGTSGLKPGDIYMATDKGVKLALDNETNSVRLLDGSDFGLSVIGSNLTLTSRSFSLTNSANRSTMLDFNAGDARIAYESGNHVLIVQSKDYLQLVSRDYRSSVTGKKEETVTGEYTMEAQNTVIHAIGHLSLEGTGQVSITSTDLFDTRVDSIQETATTNISRTSITGSIFEYVKVGNIVLSTGSADGTGTPAASAMVKLTTAGAITLDNNRSSTKHNETGEVKTEAVRYIMNAKTTANLSSTAAFDIDTKATMTISSKALMSLSTKARFSLESSLQMDIKSKAIMNVSATGVLNLKGMSITIGPNTPIVGVSTITIFGPMPLLPTG